MIHASVDSAIAIAQMMVGIADVRVFLICWYFMVAFFKLEPPLFRANAVLAILYS